MNINEIIFLQNAFKNILNESFDIEHIRFMIFKKNKFFFSKIARLINTREPRLIRHLIEIFYNSKLYDQLMFILSLGDLEISKILFKFLIKKKDGLEIISKIIIPSLITCSYNINILDPREKIYLENIWKTFLTINNKEARDIAKLSYEKIFQDQSIAKVIKNALLEAYQKIF